MEDKVKPTSDDKLEPIFSILGEKCPDIEERDRAMSFVIEILECSNSIIRFDANDFREAFLDGGDLHAFDASVNPALDYRTVVLFNDIKAKGEAYKPFNHILVFFMSPEESPLTMDELLPLNEWFDELPEEAMIRWGMATRSQNLPFSLRAIVFLQQSCR